MLINIYQIFNTNLVFVMVMIKSTQFANDSGIGVTKFCLRGELSTTTLEMDEGIGTKNSKIKIDQIAYP